MLFRVLVQGGGDGRRVVSAGGMRWRVVGGSGVFMRHFKGKSELD